MHVSQSQLVRVLGFAAIAALAGSAHAATWNGSTNNWNTPAAWSTGVTPNMNSGTEDAIINAGTVTWVPGGDFSNNRTLTIGGTSTTPAVWQHNAASTNYIKIGDGSGKTGTLTVNQYGKFLGVDSTQLILGNASGKGIVNVAGGEVTIKTGIATTLNGASELNITNGGAFSTGSATLNGTSKLTLNSGTYSSTTGLSAASGTTIDLKAGTASIGGTLTVSGGATASVSGATATVNSLTWNGALNITAGSLTTAGMGGSLGSLNVSGGSFIRNGGTLEVLTGRTFSLSGTGTVTTSSEFKVKANNIASVSGGTLNATLVSFDGTTADAATLAFSGGRINVGISGVYLGIFSSSGTGNPQDYIDFIGSGGTLFVAGLNSTQASTLVSGGLIRHNGAIDATGFKVTQITTGTPGYEFALVPEPTSLSAMAMASLAMLRRRRNAPVWRNV